MINVPVFEPGEFLTIQKIVTEDDTAVHYGSGALDTLLATPSLVALMIEAATRLVDSRLPEGYVSVGKSLSITHEKPTVLGETVTIKVSVVNQESNYIQLEMEAFDEEGVIGHGKLDRFVVNKTRLMEKAAEEAVSNQIGVNV
ncbi:thioesterase family protein [Acidaminobacter hydrogenoformans]|uniref:Predicted thioesterase n=1 Tax=Acidaminobacter hydrogenoformans DSM 2784 TaxID=1120920 RepID=A0A1G5S4C0_9FIRM|nr:hotdog domain-containing protein [Acidaminobacter hydrogenoformans]SCZ81215.1 Predicted thioesterase [Acidaminobacter hydrogenoformans DSM 2784]